MGVNALNSPRERSPGYDVKINPKIQGLQSDSQLFTPFEVQFVPYLSQLSSNKLGDSNNQKRLVFKILHWISLYYISIWTNEYLILMAYWVLWSTSPGPAWRNVAFFGCLVSSTIVSERCDHVYDINSTVSLAQIEPSICLNSIFYFLSLLRFFILFVWRKKTLLFCPALCGLTWLLLSTDLYHSV